MALTTFGKRDIKVPFADFACILLKVKPAFYILDCWSVPDILFSALYAVSVPSSRPQKGVTESVLWILSSRTSTEKPFQAIRREKQNSRIYLIIIEIQFLTNVVSISQTQHSAHSWRLICP